jgi:hypothetical protein
MIDDRFLIKEHAHYAIEMAKAGGLREMIKVVWNLDKSDPRMARDVRKELRKAYQPKWAKKVEIPLHPAIRPITGG